MKKKAFLIIFPFCVFSLFCCRHKNLSIPSEFIETIPPKLGSEDWSHLNNSQNEFKVENLEGQLKIDKVTEGDETELDISNGKLIGINRGEFGGILKFVPSDGAIKETIIKKGNIKFIFFFKDKIYFIEGLAHMGFSGGALYKLENRPDFKYEKILEFEDAPEAFTIYKDKFLIATYDGFYVVQDFKKEIILRNTFWRGLYPKSIATFDDKNIFIGLRSGIAKLDLTTLIIRFYKYQK